MEHEFTRRELYDLVWSQPMRTVAVTVGISDVALAKHCKKVGVPVPPRGYWARRQAGKPTIRVTLPPRFPGAPDRIGGSSHYHSYGSNWIEGFRRMPVPPVPAFDEEISSVADRARKLVGKVHCSRNFDAAHPLVAKLLAHDEERRKDFVKWGSSYYTPKYDRGMERRRLLIINALFLAGARLGCRPSMSTSKYGQDVGTDRDISITAGQSHTYFTIEPAKPGKEGQRERLRLSFGSARERANKNKTWEDTDENLLEQQLAEVLTEILVGGEVSYRQRLIQHREWILERKAAADAEIIRRKEETERKARELQEKLSKARIDRLLIQATAFEHARQIRAYVDTVLLRATEMPVEQAKLSEWAAWARRQADRVDPIRNGSIERAIEADSGESA